MGSAVISERPESVDEALLTPASYSRPTGTAGSHKPDTPNVLEEVRGADPSSVVWSARRRGGEGRDWSVQSMRKDPMQREDAMNGSSLTSVEAFREKIMIIITQDKTFGKKKNLTSGNVHLRIVYAS